MNARLDAGRVLIGFGAVALLVSLFLDWYGEPGSFGEGVSAWTAFELVDLLLAALALGVLASVVRNAYPESPVPPLTAGLANAFSVAALLLVVVSLIDEPPAVFGADREAGAWVALGAVIAMALGAFLTTARISVTIGPRETAADRPDPTAPDAETETLRQR